MAGGCFGQSEHCKVIDSLNNDPEVMDVKSIKANYPKPCSKPYGGPNDEGAYESAPKYEKDNDDDDMLIFSVVMILMTSYMVLMIMTTTANETPMIMPIETREQQQ